MAIDARIWDVTDPIQRLIRRRDEQLADTDVPLEELVPETEGSAA